MSKLEQEIESTRSADFKVMLLGVSVFAFIGALSAAHYYICWG